MSQFQRNTGFLLVRHPLVRLVSAYEDKMLNPHPFPYAYHHRQGQNIDLEAQCKSRIQEEIKSARAGRKVRINFPQDLLHSKRIQHMLNRKVPLLHPKKTTRKLGNTFQGVTMDELLTQPSFPEFVDWLQSSKCNRSCRRSTILT